MPDASTRLELPFILPSQSQKHVTYNEAIQRLDLLAQIAVEGFDATQPPDVPQEAQVWALAAAPQGAWAGHGDVLAAWLQQGWVFIAPQKGWIASDGASARIWSGTAWAEIAAGELSNIAGLGINSSYDATNKLAVSADATLLTHASGGHQLKINKATEADTASLLFQSAWSGRAEMGTCGNDDFEIKLSADGSNWLTGMSIDAGTGEANFPHGANFGSINVSGQISGPAVTQNQTDKSAGRLLKANDWGVGNAITLTASDDLNDLPGSGFFYNPNSENCSGNNYPLVAAGAVLCIFHSPTNGVQKFISGGADATAQGPREFTRSYGVAGWGPWVEVYHQGSILSPVSQVAGLPTGGVIERGSNANGEYVRFADGTQICMSPQMVNTSIAAGTSGSLTWSFPAAFVSTAVVIMPTAASYATQSSTVAATYFYLAARPNLPSSAMIAYRNGGPSGQFMRVQATAIGRWF